MSSNPSGGSDRKGSRCNDLLPSDELCIDLHLNNGVELSVAYRLTQPTQTYQAIWDRVNRIRKKAGDVAAVAAAKSPPPPAINPTNPSPMSYITSSMTKASSSSKKRQGDGFVASANKTAKRDEAIESSQKSLPSNLDGEKIVESIVESSSHTIGLYMTNPLEPLPPLYIFQTGVKDPENAILDPRWGNGNSYYTQ